MSGYVHSLFDDRLRGWTNVLMYMLLPGQTSVG